LPKISGPSLLAIGVFVGLLVPPLSAQLKPLMPLTVFIFVAGTFLRTNPQLLKQSFRTPRSSIAIPLVATVGLPLFVAYALGVSGIPDEVVLGIVLSLASPPSSGNAALARMFGYTGETPMTIILVTTIAVPLTMPLVGLSVNAAIDPLELMRGLALLLASAAILAICLRMYLSETIKRINDLIDLSILISLFVFAIATMDGLLAVVKENPTRVFMLLVAAFATNILCQLLGALLAPRGERLAVALSLGNRNVGLPWAVLGSTLAPTTTLFFALCQLPIFTLPLLIQIFARTRRKRAS